MELYFGLALIVIVLVVRDLLRRDPVAPPSCKRCKVGLELEARKDPFSVHGLRVVKSNLIGRKVTYVYRCPRCRRQRKIIVKEYDAHV